MTTTELAEVRERGLVPRVPTDNPALVYLSSLAPSGRQAMTYALKRLCREMGSTLADMPWAQLDYQHVQAIRTRYAERYAPATVNMLLYGLRGVVRSAWRMGQVDAETYQRIADVPPVKGSTLPAGRALGAGEIRALMETCARDATPAAARDAAIIALAYGGGLRRTEMVDLDLADVTLADDGERVTLRVVGKRHKERLVYLDNGAGYALRDWLTVRGQDEGSLFYRGRGGGRITTGKRLGGQGIREMLRRRGEKAGLAPFTPHDLRRSFVSDLLDAGVDITTVAAMAGHANVQTTARYDRRGERAKQKAAGSLHVPYVRA